MPRIRTLKPELWMSPQVMNLSHSARLLFIGLITQADDVGRGCADARRLKAAIFPGDDCSASRIETWLAEIVRARLALHYHDDEHGALYELPTWDEHQSIDRPKPSRYPSASTSRRTIDDSSTEDREGSEGSERIGSEGNGREASRHVDDAKRRQTTRASALPSNFGLTDTRKTYATGKLPNVDPDELLAAFVDYHTAKGTVARDWDATWRTYVRNGLKFGYPTLQTRPDDPKPITRYDARGRLIQ